MAAGMLGHFPGLRLLQSHWRVIGLTGMEGTTRLVAAPDWVIASSCLTRQARKLATKTIMFNKNWAL